MLAHRIAIHPGAVERCCFIGHRRAMLRRLSSGRIVQVEPEGSQGVAMRVGVSGPVSFANLGDAIAETRAGDQLILRPGRYVGGFDIDKELEVRGSNGNDGVVEIAGCHSSYGSSDAQARGSN